MTRFLSDSLAAPEPYFRQKLQQFESANQHPNADIRLTSDVAIAAAQKTSALGLDPKDTSPKELYHSLQNKVKADEHILQRLFQTTAATHVSLEADTMAGMLHVLKTQYQSMTIYGLKTTSFKQIIKKSPPKRVMKLLNYRSIDSLLRHESPSLILTAAQSVESSHWWQGYHALYRRITAQDFERRPVTIAYPDARRWNEIGQLISSHHKTNIVSIPELGSVILLPLPAKAPVGSVVGSLALAVTALNSVSAASSYLQLTQVRPDFGRQVEKVATTEPDLHTLALDSTVPWQLVHRSFRGLSQEDHQLMDTAISLDMANGYQSIGGFLRSLDERFAFWQNNEHVGLLAEGKAVSFHVLDVALNLCNELSYEMRSNRYFKESLWHELLLRYLQPQAIQASVMAGLQLQTIPAFALTKS